MAARFQQTGEFHFLTFSCYRGLAYLGSAAARDLFESVPGAFGLLSFVPSQVSKAETWGTLDLSVNRARNLGHPPIEVIIPRFGVAFFAGRTGSEMLRISHHKVQIPLAGFVMFRRNEVRSVSQ